MVELSYKPDFQTMDYANLMENFELSLALENLYFMEMRCVEEFVILNNSIKNGVFVLEDVTVNNERKDAQRQEERAKMGTGAKVWDTIKEMISKFVNFIKDIINKFKDKAQELFNGNSNWVEQNKNKLNAITDTYWNDCAITLYPYFDHGVTIFQNSIITTQSLGFINFSNKATIEKAIEAAQGNDEKQIIQALCPKVAKVVGDGGSFAEGCKTIFRGGVTEVKKYEGSAAKQVCANLMAYATAYTTTSKEISKECSTLTKQLEDMENLVKQGNYEKLKEMAMIPFNDVRLYSILEENYLYNVPEFDNVRLESFDGVELTVVGEAEAAAPADNKPASNGGVSTPSANDGGNANGNTNNTQGQQDPKSEGAEKYARAKVKVFKYAVQAETARMTIAEEAYLASIRTLKQVLTTAQRRGDVNMQKVAGNNANNNANQQQNQQASNEAKKSDSETGGSTKNGSRIANAVKSAGTKAKNMVNAVKNKIKG